MFLNQFARVLRWPAAALLLSVVLLVPAPSSGQGFKGAGKGKLPDFVPADYDDYSRRTARLIPGVF